MLCQWGLPYKEGNTKQDAHVKKGNAAPSRALTKRKKKWEFEWELGGRSELCRRVNKLRNQYWTIKWHFSCMKIAKNMH